jgi:hypothetical protein
MYSVFVLPWVQVAALRRADLLSKQSYRLCKSQETEKAAKVQERAVESYNLAARTIASVAKVTPINPVRNVARYHDC